MIQHRQEVILNKSASDFRLTCLSNQSLEALFNLSFTTEAVILSGMEAEHREQFDRAVQNGMFCHIDVNRALEHPDWKGYFQPFASVAAHVLERDSGGNWTPTIDVS